MALKKAIITVMLSALLVSSTAVPIYAVDDTDKAETQVSEEIEGNTDSEDSDEYTQFSEDTDLNDNNGDNLILLVKMRIKRNKNKIVKSKVK